MNYLRGAEVLFLYSEVYSLLMTIVLVKVHSTAALLQVPTTPVCTPEAARMPESAYYNVWGAQTLIFVPCLDIEFPPPKAAICNVASFLIWIVLVP